MKYMGFARTKMLNINLPSTQFPAMRYFSFNWGLNSFSERQFSFNNDAAKFDIEDKYYHSEIDFKGHVTRREFATTPTPKFTPSPWEMKMYN